MGKKWKTHKKRKKWSGASDNKRDDIKLHGALAKATTKCKNGFEFPN